MCLGMKSCREFFRRATSASSQHLSHCTADAWRTVNMDVSLATRTILRLRQLTEGLWQDDFSREECMHI